MCAKGRAFHLGRLNIIPKVGLFCGSYGSGFERDKQGRDTHARRPNPSVATVTYCFLFVSNEPVLFPRSPFSFVSILARRSCGSNLAVSGCVQCGECGFFDQACLTRWCFFLSSSLSPFSPLAGTCDRYMQIKSEVTHGTCHMGYGQDTCTILLVLVLVSELFSLLFLPKPREPMLDPIRCTAVGDNDQPVCLTTYVQSEG